MSGNYSKPKNTPCFWCVRAIKWVPVLFIMTIIGWSYYAYVVQLCLFSVKTLTEQILFLIFYHVVFIMFIWSYWQTVWTQIGTVPPKFRVPRSEVDKLVNADSQETQKMILETFARDLPVNNRTLTGSIRFCEKCMVIKPDRAHHCSVCGMCVLKMDHHCPWVNNCVNFTNYKYFVLFLGYALIYCIYIAATGLRYFILFWEGELQGGMGRFHILFLFFVAVMFAISLVSLFGYHIYLVSLNRTTLEAFRSPVFRVGGPDKNGYNLGRYNNLQEVFGDDRKLWFLPMFSSRGDGVEYPMQSQHKLALTTYESMGDTSARIQDPHINENSETISMSSDEGELVANTANSQNNLIESSRNVTVVLDTSNGAVGVSSTSIGRVRSDISSNRIEV